jgi:hypothetical protein
MQRDDRALRRRKVAAPAPDRLAIAAAYDDIGEIGRKRWAL